MAKSALIDLVGDALNISEIKEALSDIISDELDPRGIARVIFDQYEDEIIEAAADAAAEIIF